MLVPVRIYQLQVNEPEGDHLYQRSDDGPVSVNTVNQCGEHSMSFGLLAKSAGELQLHQRLSFGEGHTSTGVAVISGIKRSVNISCDALREGLL